MSGYRTQTVYYNDPWDCGKQDSTEEPYYLEYNGTFDVVEFNRNGESIVFLSKGDAWLLMCALQKMMRIEEPYLFNQQNPFE